MDIRLLVSIGGVLLCTLSFATPSAAGDAGGDDFRYAAAEYEREAQAAIVKAAQAEGADAGRYVQLATVFRQMAEIKHRAARLADEERWGEISWDRYEHLDAKRQQIQDEAAAHHASGGDHGDDGAGFLSAAREYQSQAERARRQARARSGVEGAIYEELAEIFNAMAHIEESAAQAAERGRDISWDDYEALAVRRDKLEGMLSQL